MFYKRITDLHPVGIPINGNWNEISAISIPHSGEVLSSSSEQEDKKTIGEVTLVNENAQPWETGASEKWPLSNDTSFRDAKWYNLGSRNIEYRDVSTEYVQETSDNITSEYYNKALWFEVAISKNASNVPTSNLSKINLYD